MLPLLQHGQFERRMGLAGSGEAAIGKIVNYGLERAAAHRAAAKTSTPRWKKA